MLINAIFQTPFTISPWKKVTRRLIISSLETLTYVIWNDIRVTKWPFLFFMQKHTWCASTTGACQSAKVSKMLDSLMHILVSHTLLLLKELHSYFSSWINFMIYCNSCRTVRTMIPFMRNVWLLHSPMCWQTREKKTQQYWIPLDA